VAAVLKTALGVEPELAEGGRGEFTVWVGDEVVARKDSNGFPSDDDALAGVQRALSRD
jgi:hypothetical protein